MNDDHAPKLLDGSFVPFLFLVCIAVIAITCTPSVFPRVVTEDVEVIAIIIDVDYAPEITKILHQNTADGMKYEYGVTQDHFVVWLIGHPYLVQRLEQTINDYTEKRDRAGVYDHD